jgi:hypothetical protein
VSSGEEPEVVEEDLFADMAPKIRKQKKVFIGSGGLSLFFLYMNGRKYRYSFHSGGTRYQKPQGREEKIYTYR